MRKFTIFINVCVLFFLITYFFLSRWYLLLFVRFSSCVYHVLTESFLVIRGKKRDHSQKNYQSRITLTFMGNIYLCPVACLSILSWHFYWRPVSQWYEHPRVLGILIPKPLVIWVIPLTLTQIAKVVWEGDAYIASVFNGNGDAQNAGMPISLSQRGYSTDFTMGVCGWVFETLDLFHTK